MGFQSRCCGAGVGREEPLRGSRGARDHHRCGPRQRREWSCWRRRKRGLGVGVRRARKELQRRWGQPAAAEREGLRRRLEVSGGQRERGHDPFGATMQWAPNHAGRRRARIPCRFGRPPPARGPRAPRAGLAFDPPAAPEPRLPRERAVLWAHVPWWRGTWSKCAGWRSLAVRGREAQRRRRVSPTAQAGEA